MNVEQLIQRIRQLDDNSVVFVDTRQELSPDTSVVVVPLGNDDEPEYVPSGFGELMDVWQVQELLRSQAEVNGVHKPSPEQKIQWLLERLRAQGWSSDSSGPDRELQVRHSGGGGYRRVSHGDHDA